MDWLYQEFPLKIVRHFSQQLGISDILAKLLLSRGINTFEDAQHFLFPRLIQLEDPFAITHMAKAVERIDSAIKKKERIVLLGDYDVDGITSITLLGLILKRLGSPFDYSVPKRFDEGYGLSLNVIQRILEETHPQLFIALDCGTNSVNEVAFLKEKGIDVIIIDHHRSKDQLPIDCILVNPHVYDDQSVCAKNLCTVGLVFKLIHGLIKNLRHEGFSDAFNFSLKDYLDLVAMGTISDLVPLEKDNRIMSKFGLEQLKTTTLIGLQSLFKVSGMKLGQTVAPADIAFKLGPRINASGRLADASLPIKMLLSNDSNESNKIARYLDDVNRERQMIERAIALEAENIVEATQKDAAGLVLFNKDWHPGVVGIVAGRLARQYNRPCIVLGGEGDLAKGSGRSIAGISLVEILGECSELLESWGGHPLAAGVALKASQVEALQKKFASLVAIKMNSQLPEATIDIAHCIETNMIDRKFLEELDLLQPYGMSNPEPIFVLQKFRLPQQIKYFGEGNEHIRFVIDLKNNLKANIIGWKMKNFFPQEDKSIDLAVKIGWNRWNGREELQLEIIDWKFSKE